jgi:hypothetical protein
MHGAASRADVPRQVIASRYQERDRLAAGTAKFHEATSVRGLRATMLTFRAKPSRAVETRLELPLKIGIIGTQEQQSIFHFDGSRCAAIRQISNRGGDHAKARCSHSAGRDRR